MEMLSPRLCGNLQNHRWHLRAFAPATFYQRRNRLADLVAGRLRRMRNHFPMQKVEKIRLRMSSGVVAPVRESSAHSAR